MIDVALVLVVALALGAAALALWRGARDPAAVRRGLALRVALVALVVLPSVTFGAWRVSKARQFQLMGQLVTRVDTQQPLVALTFDDGPTPQGTAAILD
ncbi:MAG: hypothetical protein GX605_06145, partial [Chloroflexi bacterium]|nr:hypothetical protein [Chloroflexota bacterium]